MKPTKYSVKKKKNEAIKVKKEGEEILLSAHARTSQANILYLDQKATKCMTCKWVYGKV